MSSLSVFRFMLFSCVITAILLALFAMKSSEYLLSSPRVLWDLPASGQQQQGVMRQEKEEETITTTSSSTSKEERLQRYKSLYQHHPPDSPTPENPRKSTEELCGKAPAFSGYTKQKKWIQSQFGEEWALYQSLFHNITATKGATFVELGAFDGSHWSNTRFFEECLGWKGLLIEASPRIFPKLKANRPFAHRLSFAPTCSMKEALDNKTITFSNSAKPGSGVHDNASTSSFVDVPCGPLGPVLEDLQPHTTFFSLDVEKSEPKVLKTIDFNKVQVDVWMVECQKVGGMHNNQGGVPTETVLETREILASAGYKRYEGVVKNSDLFIHPKSPHQLPSTIKPNHDPATTTATEAATIS